MVSAGKQKASSSKASCIGLILQYHFLATATYHKGERILLKSFLKITNKQKAHFKHVSWHNMRTQETKLKDS